jgi:hypothetical protein
MTREFEEQADRPYLFVLNGVLKFKKFAKELLILWKALVEIISCTYMYIHLIKPDLI